MELKYGRKAPKRAPSLRLCNYLTGVVPTHPVYEDYLAALGGGWDMLGNDRLGDCVSVTWANTRRLVSSTLGAPSYPDIDKVMTFYATQNPGGSDNGMDIQTALEDLVAHGGPDGVSAVGFASVNHADLDEVTAAIAIFGSVWTGVNVLSINEQQFREQVPWDFVPGSPAVGGHSVITGGYGKIDADTGALSGDNKFITWAAETSFTDAYWSECVEEAWVVIWPEHLGAHEFLAGIDLAAFAADYTLITGKPFPAAPIKLEPVTPAVSAIVVPEPHPRWGA